MTTIDLIVGGGEAKVSPFTKEEQIERAWHLHRAGYRTENAEDIELLASLIDIPEVRRNVVFFKRREGKRIINWVRLAPGLRERLSGEQNHRCCHCGVRMTFPNGKSSLTEMTFEHVVPLGIGGQDHPDNMVIACRKCNNARGINTEWEAPKKAPCW